MIADPTLNTSLNTNGMEQAEMKTAQTLHLLDCECHWRHLEKSAALSLHSMDMTLYFAGRALHHRTVVPAGSEKSVVWH